jgi:hypothetical protein
MFLPRGVGGGMHIFQYVHPCLCIRHHSGDIECAKHHWDNTSENGAMTRMRELIHFFPG